MVIPMQFTRLKLRLWLNLAFIDIKEDVDYV